MKNDNKGIAAGLFYMALSPSMAFMNKALLTSYHFNFPFTIMAFQMAVTIVFLEILCRLKVISIPSYSIYKGYSFLWPSLFYASTSVSSLLALNAMNIPMYGTIKRCGPLVTLFFTVVILKKPCPSPVITSSVVFISLGAIIAGIGDMTTDKSAYLFGTISVFSQACYLTLTQKSAENNMSSLHILQLNSYNTLPVFIVCIFLRGENSSAMPQLMMNHFGFYVTFSLVVCCGALMNYSLFLCTVLNSALTTSLIGVIKSVLQTAIGFFTFGGVQILPLNTTGIFMNLFGGIVYTYAKYKSRLASKSAAGSDVEGGVHDPKPVS